MQDKELTSQPLHISTASEEIGDTIEQDYNSPILESGTLLSNTTADHYVRNVYSNNIILSGEVCITVS